MRCVRNILRLGSIVSGAYTIHQGFNSLKKKPQIPPKTPIAPLTPPIIPPENSSKTPLPQTGADAPQPSLTPLNAACTKALAAQLRFQQALADAAEAERKRRERCAQLEQQLKELKVVSENLRIALANARTKETHAQKVESDATATAEQKLGARQEADDAKQQAELLRAQCRALHLQMAN